jgi:hypothetical protein
VSGEPVQENNGPRPHLHSTDRQAERGDVPPRPPHGHAAGQNARPRQAHEISIRHWVKVTLTTPIYKLLMGNYFAGTTLTRIFLVRICTSSICSINPSSARREQCRWPGASRTWSGEVTRATR